MLSSTLAHCKQSINVNNTQAFCKKIPLKDEGSLTDHHTCINYHDLEPS